MVAFEHMSREVRRMLELDAHQWVIQLLRKALQGFFTLQPESLHAQLFVFKVNFLSKHSPITLKRFQNSFSKVHDLYLSSCQKNLCTYIISTLFLHTMNRAKS